MIAIIVIGLALGSFIGYRPDRFVNLVSRYPIPAAVVALVVVGMFIVPTMAQTGVAVFIAASIFAAAASDQLRRKADFVK